MSKFILLALTVVALCCGACKKDNSADSAYFMKAKRNGIAWSTSPSASFDIHDTRYDTLSLMGYTSAGEEHLYLPVRRNSQGAYIPQYASFYYQNTIGQDVLVSNYILDSTAVNTLTINQVDINNKVVSGNFDLTFKKQQGNSTFPATVHFTQGSFAAKISVRDYSKGPFVY